MDYIIMIVIGLILVSIGGYRGYKSLKKPAARGARDAELDQLRYILKQTLEQRIRNAEQDARDSVPDSDDDIARLTQSIINRVRRGE